MSVTAGEQSRRASYGRGVIEGLRMAGIENPGDFMNANKLARIESGLNSMAKKVLEAVPIQECWTKSQIGVELRRLGCGAARDVIDGCLSTLADNGLIKEPERGSFIRVGARQPISTPAPKEPTPVTSSTRTTANEPPATSTSTSTSTSADTLTRLANLGALLRRAADECDAIALEAEARIQAAGKEGENLRKLQALLKEIGG